MERVNCPLCKVEVIVVLDRPAWFGGWAGMVIAPHIPGPQAGPHPALHIHSDRCLGSHCTVEMAEGVAADRARGLHLTAHP